jgi:hypothetical protein
MKTLKMRTDAVRVQPKVLGELLGGYRAPQLVEQREQLCSRRLGQHVPRSGQYIHRLSFAKAG